MTTYSQPVGPVADLVHQLSDAGVADLDLTLTGITLPWRQLGGSAALTPGQPAGVVVALGLGQAQEALAAEAITLVDRELTPLARLIDLDSVADSPAATGQVSGELRAERPREAQQFAELAAPPDPSTGGTFVLAGRPPLTGELAALSKSGPLTVLVPTENPTPDGLPPNVLVRSIQAALCTEHLEARIVAVPLYWRDPASNTALVQTVIQAYAGPEGATAILSSDQAPWRAVLAAIAQGQAVPANISPEVSKVLLRWRPPRHRRGLVLLFTGFSGSGKSTVARDVAEFLDTESDRTVSLLDGDDVRRMLSAGLGFDRDSRIMNVRRIGYVASEIARHGGVAICAPIAPYAETRAQVRAMIEPVGDFLLVHVNTPLAECERRDLKGLYAKARAGQIPEFTGISDPYDVPEDAELTIDTSTMSRAQALGRVLNHLRDGGWLIPGGTHGD